MFKTVVWILIALCVSTPVFSGDGGCVWESPHFNGLPLYPNSVAASDITALSLRDASVFVSHDGVAWFEREDLSGTPLNGVTWTGSRFVVVGDGGTVLTSPDGVTWRDHDRPGVTDLVAVSGYGDEILVQGRDRSCSRWSDGAWHDCSFPDELTSFTLAAGPAGYVAVQTEVWFSSSGENWQIVSPSSWANGTNIPFLWDVIFDGDLFWVLNPLGLAHSPDGLAWDIEPVEVSTPPQGYYWVYQFLPRGSHGDWIVEVDDYFNATYSIRRSSDNTWSYESIDYRNLESGVRLGGHEVLVNSGPGRLMPYDMPSIIRGQEEWRDVTYQFPLEYLQSIRPYGELWVATTCYDDWYDFVDVCNIYSADHLGSWQQQARTDDLFWIVRHQDQWVTMNYAEGLKISSDLQTWETPTEAFRIVGSNTGVSNGEVMVVLGAQFAAISEDLWEWSFQEQEQYWEDGVWTGERFVFCGMDGVVGTSADGMDWTVTTVDPTIDFTDIESGNEVLIMTGGAPASISFRSDDGGLTWQNIDPWAGGQYGSVAWIGDRFMACSDLGCRESSDGRDWQPAYSQAVGTVYWGGVVDGERLFVADDGVMVYEMCPGEQLFPAAAARLVVPVTASVKGTLDSTWASKFELLNPTDEWQRIVFSLGNTETTQMMMPPRMQMRSEDVLVELFGLEETKRSLEIAAEGQVAVTSVISTSSGAGRVGQGIPVLTEDEILHGVTMVVIPGLVEDSTWRSNLGIANLGHDLLSVEAQFLTDDGNNIGRIDIEVLPGEVRQLNQVLRRFGPDFPHSSTVLLRATEPDALYTAWGSIVHNRNKDPSFRIATAPRSGPQILAAAAETRGIDDISWTTDLDLFNPGDSAAAVEISVLPTSGFQSPSTRTTIAVPARSTRTLPSVVENLFDGRGVTALRIDPGEGAVVVATRTATGCGAVGQGIPAVAEPLLLEPDERLVIAGLHEDEERRSNVGVVNLEDRWVEVGVTIFSAVGDVVEEFVQSLPPQSLTQFNRVLLMAGEPRPNTGWLEIRARNQSARLLAWSSVVDNTTEDPAFSFAKRIDQTEGSR